MSPKSPSKNQANKGFLKKSLPFSQSQLIGFAIVFALIGGFILIKSWAAGPLVAAVEAEQMNLPTGASIINDSAASGGKAVLFNTNGSAKASLSLSSQVMSMTITAKATQCSGAPTLGATVDSTAVMSNQSISNTSWSDFTSSTNLAGGTHQLTITASNLASVSHGKKNSCSRALYVDVTYLYGPMPAPTVSISASPSSINAGQSSTLSWNSTNATSCTASGDWSGSQPLSGSTSSGSLNQTSTYSLSCTGGGGTTTSSTTVNVNSQAQISASFTASQTSGTAPLNVMFTDTSTGSPTSWYWNFGDGATSTSQNPSHSYSNTGTYDVTLTASNSGSSATINKVGFITVTAPVTGGQTYITPEGMTIKTSADVTTWTPQQIYQQLVLPNAFELSKVGPKITVIMQNQYASQTSDGASSTGSPPVYSNYSATIYLKELNSSFTAAPDAVFTHEYGVAWTQYHLFLSHSGDWTPYLNERWDNADGSVRLVSDSRLDSNLNWSRNELIADDYRMLFGSAKAQSELTYINPYIPDPRNQPDLKSWFTSYWAVP